MFKSFTTYKVEIIEEEFVNSSSGLTYNQTAIIHLFDDKNKEIQTEKLGVLSIENIYEAIENQTPINLNNSYIKDFSLSNYRKSHQLTPEFTIKLPRFSAKETFFDSDKKLDLSYTKFHNSPLNFDNSVFAVPCVSFSHSEFGEGTKDFENVIYFLCDVDFSNVH